MKSISFPCDALLRVMKVQWLVKARDHPAQSLIANYCRRKSRCFVEGSGLLIG